MSDVTHNDCLILRDLKKLLREYVDSLNEEALKIRANEVVHNLKIDVCDMKGNHKISKQLMSLGIVNIPSKPTTSNNVVHPAHYNTDNPIITYKHKDTTISISIECIDVIRNMPSWKGNAIKYLWRAGLKKDAELNDTCKEIEDLRKAVFYINDRIEQLSTKKSI